MRGPTDWQRYAWADGADLTASCLAVVISALTERDVIAAHRLDSGSCELLSAAAYEERPALSEEANGAQVWVEGGAVVVREFGGFVGSIGEGGVVVLRDQRGLVGFTDEVAAALSRGGRYAAYDWNGVGDAGFVYAVDGTVQRTFDPVVYEAAGALAEEADLPWGTEDAEDENVPFYSDSCVLALLERLSGVRFDDAEALYTMPRPFYRRLPA